MTSPADLWAEAPGLYQRYCEELGVVVDPNDQTLTPLTPGRQENAAETESLRARLQEILRALLVLLATLALAGFLWLLQKLEFPFLAVTSTVVYAGILGGAVRCTRRLEGVSTKGDALGSIYSLKNSRYVLNFAPLTGAVFAVVTMLLFMGKVITGVVFPSFEWLVALGAVVSTWQFLRLLLPKSPEDYALLFLWCFIAGFAERFIPDTLSQLADRASAQEASSGSSNGVEKKLAAR
jgi:hypothetical protein